MSRLCILLCILPVIMGIMNHERKFNKPKEGKVPRQLLTTEMFSMSQESYSFQVDCDCGCDCDQSGAFSMGCHHHSYDTSGDYWYYGEDEGSMQYSTSYQQEILPSGQPTSLPDDPITPPPSSPSDPTFDTVAPSEAPTAAPTDGPTVAPTNAESQPESETPTEAPTSFPTEGPSNAVIVSESPTAAPSFVQPDPPSSSVEDDSPTEMPSTSPISFPTLSPTPITAPTEVSFDPPSETPTEAPTSAPSELVVVTSSPSLAPTFAVTSPGGQIQIIIILIVVNLQVTQANSAEFQNLILSIVSSLLGLPVQLLSVNSITTIGVSTRRLGENQLAVTVGATVDSSEAPQMLNMLADIINSGKLSQEFQQRVVGTEFQGASLVTSQAKIAPPNQPTNPPSGDNSDSSSKKSDDSSNNIMMGVIIGCSVLVGAGLIGWYSHRSGYFAKGKKVVGSGDEVSPHQSVELDLPTIFKENMEDGYFVQRNQAGEDSWYRSFYGKSTRGQGIFLKRGSGGSTTNSTDVASEKHVSMELDVSVTDDARTIEEV